VNVADIKVGVLVRAPEISIRNRARVYRVVGTHRTRNAELSVDLEAVTPPALRHPLRYVHHEHLVPAVDGDTGNGHRISLGPYNKGLCLYCGRAEGDMAPCVPRFDVAPEGLFTTRAAMAKFEVSYSTFIARYQDRRLYPVALLGPGCSYLWDEVTLGKVALSNAEWRAQSRAVPS
jgi:hypothetical protein